MPLSPYRSTCYLAVSLLLVSCQRPSEAAKQQATTSPVPSVALAVAPTAQSVQPAATAPILADLAGVWRVTGVYADGQRQPTNPALGALLDVSQEELRWSYHAPGGAMATDRCGQPGIAELSANAAGQQASRDLAQAALVLTGKPAALPLALGWECGDGHWGPGKIGTSNFTMIDPQQLVTVWYAGSYLQLERISRPDPERGPSDADANVKADDFAN